MHRPLPMEPSPVPSTGRLQTVYKTTLNEFVCANPTGVFTPWIVQSSWERYAVALLDGF
jgi:hypothetical protein